MTSSLGLALPRPNYIGRNVVFIIRVVDQILFSAVVLNAINQQQMTSSNSPKNWSQWNNSKHFTDYSRDSVTGKFVRFTIASLLFVPVGFLAYMTTI